MDRVDARGSGTLLNVAVMMILLALSAAVAVCCRYLIADHQARNAADLSALAGAQARGRGDDACRAARRIAEENAARLVSCRVVGDGVDFVISVRAAVEVGQPAVGLPNAMVRDAHAGPVR